MNDVDNHHAFKMAKCHAFMTSFNHLSLYHLWLSACARTGPMHPKSLNSEILQSETSLLLLVFWTKHDMSNINIMSYNWKDYFVNNLFKLKGPNGYVLWLLNHSPKSGVGSSPGDATQNAPSKSEMAQPVLPFSFRSPHLEIRRMDVPAGSCRDL